MQKHFICSRRIKHKLLLEISIITSEQKNTDLGFLVFWLWQQKSEEKTKKQIEGRATKGKQYASLGNACLSLGEFKKALEFYEKYLDIVKEIGDRIGEGRVYGGIACAYLSLGDFQEAIKFYQQRLSIGKEVGDRRGEVIAWENIAKAYFSLGDFRKAAEYHQLNLSFAKEVGDTAGEGRAYGNLGNAYLSLGDFQKAIDFFKVRLDIAKELGDKVSEGKAYGSLGNAYISLGDFKTAIKYHEWDLDFAKQAGDRSGEGRAHSNLGSAYFYLGDLRKSLHSYEVGLGIAKEVKDRAGEGRLYGNLGNVYDSLGDVAKAINYHQLQLSIAKELSNRAGEGNAYGDLGNCYKSLGDFKKAVEYYELWLSISKEVGDRAGEGRAYGNLGNACSKTGNVKKAMEYHQLQLSLAKEVGDKAEEGRAYGNLGGDFRGRGDFKEAIENQELSLSIAKALGNKIEEGSSYGNLGSAYFSLGDFESAKRYFELRLRIAEETEDKAGEGRAHGNLGSAFLSLGDFQNAIEHYQRRLSITKEIGDKAGEGRVYANLGNVHDSLGDRNKAIEHFKLSLGIAKEVGDKNAEGSCYCNLGIAHHSLGDFQKAIEYQKQYLNICKESGDAVGEGNAYDNLGEAYYSLGDLGQSEDFYRLSVERYDKVRDLLQTKDQWKIRLRDHHDEAYTGLVTVLLKQEKVTEALLTAEQGRAQALKDLIKSQYGLDLDPPRPIAKENDINETLSHITSQLIFLAASTKELNFWVLQKGKDVQFRQKEIDKAYAKKDVMAALQSLTKGAYEKIRVNRDVQCENRALDEPTIDNGADRRCEEDGIISHREDSPLRSLYEMIIDPIADLIEGDDLIIVPDGPLFLAPFAALLGPGSKFFSESLRIRLIPSLSTMKLIAECPESFHSKSKALLVGDPCLAKVKRKRLGQLPFAKKEVEMIGEILNVHPLVGKEATKAEVMKTLSSVALVHIAAHGSMERGEIALSPNPERSSKVPKKEDYLLTMEDVLSCPISAKLVVLSCCHSGQGEIKAEGVVGIARAFLGAGARSVLVSLWAIDDEATQEFMRCFYEHLVKGCSASEALHQTRKCLRESESFRDVKYWAPFMLIGDNVTLDLGEKK